jgi:hypothetical protein
MNTVSRNPEGLLLLAAGAALLMRSGRGQRTRYPQSKDSGGRQYPESQYSQSGKGMSERLSEAVQRAGEYVSEATDEVAGTARSYASSAMDYADEATQAAMERSRRLAEQAQETTDYVVQEQDALDQQVAQGAKVVTKVAKSARRAADELEIDAPQIAGLVRGVADRVEEYSRNLESRSVTDLYQAASNFTRILTKSRITHFFPHSR